jgi:hypothetical protein
LAARGAAFAVATPIATTSASATAAITATVAFARPAVFARRAGATFVAGMLGARALRSTLAGRTLLARRLRAALRLAALFAASVGSFVAHAVAWGLFAAPLGGPTGAAGLTLLGAGRNVAVAVFAGDGLGGGVFAPLEGTENLADEFA